MNTSLDVRVEFLSEHMSVIPALAEWFMEEWNPWYGINGPGDAELDLRESAAQGRLPLGVVALGPANEVLGTAALKTESAGSDAAPGPWLAGLVVGKQFRLKGIGGKLIATIEHEALQLGFDQLFTSTNTMTGLLISRGWQEYGETDTLRGTAYIYRCDLGRSKGVK